MLKIIKKREVKFNNEFVSNTYLAIYQISVEYINFGKKN